MGAPKGCKQHGHARLGLAGHEYKTKLWASGLHRNDGNGKWKRTTETENENAAHAHKCPRVQLARFPDETVAHLNQDLIDRAFCLINEKKTSSPPLL